MHPSIRNVEQTVLDSTELKKYKKMEEKFNLFIYKSSAYSIHIMYSLTSFTIFHYNMLTNYKRSLHS